ncbi:MAG TPA: FliA/WhiG family RNA polymerase sigma factor [Clostridia bacterium]|nr:FliA/WhiG family RNA polymerase sigma factor [Clostridia bacterium]
MDIDRSVWLKYRKSKDINIRNHILLHYAPIVKYVVARLNTRVNSYLDSNDMAGWGMLGLIDAIERFDPDKGVKFTTYASLRIRGHIIDQIRKQDWVPRSVRAKAKEVLQCYDQLTLKLGRQPSENEVAESLKITVDQLNGVLENTYLYNVVSLEEQLLDIAAMHAGNDDQSPQKEYEEKELQAALAGFIKDLPENERQVLTLYYYEELTLKEIGKVLGVSESRVSQIHSKAIFKLKSKLQSFLVPA